LLYAISPIFFILRIRASYVVQAVKPFINHAAMIEDFWKSVFLDTKVISHIVEQKTITYTARGKVKTNLVRYFTGTLKRLMDWTYSELPLDVFQPEHVFPTIYSF
jgi:hypothetical protein